MKDFKDFTRERSDKEVLKRLIGYGKPYKKDIIKAFIYMIISVLIDVLPPLLLGFIIQFLTDGALSEADKIIRVIIFVVLYVVLVLVGNILFYKQSMLLQFMGQQIVLELRREVFVHIENLAIEQINEVPVGKLVTRVMNDTNAINEMYTSVMVNLIRNVTSIILMFIIMFIINWKITLIIAILLPLVLVASLIFRRFSRSSYRIVRSNVSEINAFLSENLSGIKITQIFNQEEKKQKEFKERTRQLRKSHFREIMVFGFYRPFIYLMSMVGAVVVIYFGFKEFLNNPLFTAALLYSYYLYVQNFFEPIQQLSEQYNTIQNAFASAEKVFDVLDTKPLITDQEDAIELSDFHGQIEFKNVWFYYIENEWVLKDINFTVKKGETVAFVGATGSGKSTILNLIVRNYDVVKGQILIDGIDIKNIKRSSLRKHIGQMLQDVFLFSGTIYDNISLHQEHVTKEDVIKASQYVGVDQFIESLPDGYDHEVLERGNNFSSGQRQLISFARVLVYQPSLMILDEATANIDSETEKLIQDSLNKMMKDHTMLIVAHRLSTIQHSDKIIVMQKGEIKEVGNHQQLLKLKGLYYHLYEIQFEEKNINNSSST